MDLTPFVKPVFKSRVKKIARYATDAEDIQRSVLKHLVGKASGTEWGSITTRPSAVTSSLPVRLPFRIMSPSKVI